MSHKDDVREFLISRRAHVTPEQAGLPDYGGERRVPGLRREEVAMLAGVSIDYYTRLERGNIRGASESVLNAIARALQLDDVEREYLFGLARPAPSKAEKPASKPAGATVRPSVQRVLDNMAVPALVFNPQQDVVASNLMGRAFFSPAFEAEHPNMCRFFFLDPRAEQFCTDLPQARSMNAAMLRLHAGRDPLNSELTALIGELSTLSPQFRTDWADHHVHEHRHGQKVYRHPVVGEIEITFDAFDMPGETGLMICTYTAEENSPSAERMALLASWAATQDFSIDPATEPTASTAQNSRNG
ncbi:helix-turn-helix transcriptional regulator [Actinoplanes couchii]|uniref:Transcriptional regulator n=1 Tax=Actinoplanes couchii TaxID=403638 RepID=A0ABQ3XHY5_9ACTN|nr:helix-turn-helix transcriptional regulator [Actinoplanes couchii]MDR6317722.1 transcriptional regulator with XRE-family HTH domain [Actinoplanes couchii]GID58106.1 transcriptional regulator [Actinoplanes couchii]